MLKKVIQRFTALFKSSEKKVQAEPIKHKKNRRNNRRQKLVEGAISRDQHSISRGQISDSALDVLYGLSRAGYDSYLVGGGVRDLLLGLEPKDFDVVTNAKPEQVKRVFRRCRLIGRRFRLAHVMSRGDVIEVATYRGDSGSDGIKRRVNQEGRLERDNVYGTLDEDIYRRDFTVNALYYNIRDFSVVDRVGGLDDLKAGVLRMIGEPEERYREDPVRMLRSVRFAVKLGFRMEPATEAPIQELGHLLSNIPSARLFDEALKLFHGGKAVQTFESLRHYDLFRYLFPQTDECLNNPMDDRMREVLLAVLKSTDNRVQQGKPINPSFLFAAMLWEPMQRLQIQFMERHNMPEQEAFFQASDEVIGRQIQSISIPKKFTAQIRETWFFQYRLMRRGGKRAFKLMEESRFRAAYDFLVLRAEAMQDEELMKLGQWWTDFQEVSQSERERMVGEVGSPRGKGKKRRRYKKRKPKASAE